MTSSGDGTAHIWQCAVHLTNESSSGRMASSEDELDPLERESNQAFGKFFQLTVFQNSFKSLIFTTFKSYDIFGIFGKHCAFFLMSAKTGLFSF